MGVEVVVPAVLRVEEAHKLRLRNRLHEITTIDLCPLALQPDAIARLAKEFPHTVRLLSEQADPPDDRRALTCHAFALGLLEIEPVSLPTGELLVPSAELVSYLVENVLEETSQAEDGCLVVYIDQGEIQHTGRWQAGRVVSKWGSGHIWSHEVFETPAPYGCMVRTFRTLDAHESRRRWEEHIRPFVNKSAEDR